MFVKKIVILSTYTCTPVKNLASCCKTSSSHIIIIFKLICVRPVEVKLYGFTCTGMQDVSTKIIAKMQIFGEKKNWLLNGVPVYIIRRTQVVQVDHKYFHAYQDHKYHF